MIHLVSCGYRFVHPKGITIDRPNGAGNYAFVLFQSKSEVVLHGVSHIVESGTYILYRPTTPQYYREIDLPFDNDWFHCEGDELAAFLAELQFPLDTLVQTVDPPFVTRSIMELQRIRRLGGPLGDRVIDAELRAFFLKLCQFRELGTRLPEQPGRYYRQFAEIRDQLYQLPHWNVPIEELAARVNLSKSYFQHLYKELFDCSVGTDRINGRLEQAKYLLANSTLSISEIAARCGYEYDTHFMRQFKKFVGVTPRQFRAEVNGEFTQ